LFLQFLFFLHQMSARRAASCSPTWRSAPSRAQPSTRSWPRSCTLSISTGRESGRRKSFCPRRQHLHDDRYLCRMAQLAHSCRINDVVIKPFHFSYSFYLRIFHCCTKIIGKGRGKLRNILKI
jgi:hypothetical protein